MGCEPSHFTQDRTKTSQFLETQVGLLDINIANGKLFQKNIYNGTGKQANVLFKIQVSNQQYISRVCSNFGSEGLFNSYFSFFINSNYRANGRILQVELFRKNQHPGLESLGKAIVDITSLIGRNEVQRQIKCPLNNKNEPLGFINCMLSFTPLDYKNVSFRIQNFILRKRGLIPLDLRVQILLGEEELSTPSCKDLPQKPASWTQNILSFKVPTLLKFGKIMLFDRNRYLGETVIKVQEFMSMKQGEELMFLTQLHDKDHNELGSIKYSIIVSKTPEFINEKNESVQHTNLQINVSRAEICGSMKKSCVSSSATTGVQIVIKNKDSPAKFVEDLDSEILENIRNFGSNQFLTNSMGQFSVFSIEELSRIENKSEQ